MQAAITKERIFFDTLSKSQDTIIQMGLVNTIKQLYSPENFAEFISENQNNDIYFLGNVNKDLQLARAKDSDITKKSYVFFDFDIRKKDLDITDQQIKDKAEQVKEALEDWGEDYSEFFSINFTGNGIHIYYVFPEDLDIKNKNEYATAYNEIGAELSKFVGVSHDTSCANPARIARIPGSVNQQNKGLLDKPNKSCVLFLNKDCRAERLYKFFKEYKLPELTDREKEYLKLTKTQAGNAFIDGLDSLVLQNILRIPVSKEIMDWAPTIGKNLTFNGKNFLGLERKEDGISAFIPPNENFLVVSDTRHIKTEYKGLNTFNFVKEARNLTIENTYKYFQNKYPSVTQIEVKTTGQMNLPKVGTMFLNTTDDSHYYIDTNNMHCGPVSKGNLKTYLNNLGIKYDSKNIKTIKFVYNPEILNFVDEKNNTYNTFRPTKYHLMSPTQHQISLSDCPNINLLLTNLVPEEEERDNLINWVACVLQTRKKLQTSFLFLGKQGSGKNTFLTTVLGKLFGKGNVGIDSATALNKEFNGFLEEKIFFAFDEKKKQARSSEDNITSTLKMYITNETISIEKKGANREEIPNTTNFMLFSNDDSPIVIEKNDRRFNVVRTGPNLNETPNWDFEKFQKGVGLEIDKFAQFLWNYKIDIKRANHPLNNTVKNTLIETSEDTLSYLINSLKEGNVDILEEIIDLHPQKKVNGYDDFERKHGLDIDDIQKTGRIYVAEFVQFIKDYVYTIKIAENTIAKKIKAMGIESVRETTGDKKRYYFFENIIRY